MLTFGFCLAYPGVVNRIIYENQKLNEPVGVLCEHQINPTLVTPKLVYWKNREYHVRQLGLHHVFRQGKTLFHVFSVVTDTLFMRLVLNTDTLFWKLEETANINESV